MCNQFYLIFLYMTLHAKKFRKDGIFWILERKKAEKIWLQNSYSLKKKSNKKHTHTNCRNMIIKVLNSIGVEIIKSRFILCIIMNLICLKIQFNYTGCFITINDTKCIAHLIYFLFTCIFNFFLIQEYIYRYRSKKHNWYRFFRWMLLIVIWTNIYG